MKIFVILLFFIMFLIWALFMRKGVLKKADDFMYERIKFHNTKTSFYRFVTIFASTPFLIIACVLFVLLFSDKKIAFSLAFIMIIDAIIVYIVKHIFRRERPNKKRLVSEKGYSFPSGHTFSATCFYGFLFYLFFFPMSIFYQTSFGLLYLLLVFLIARSRIYLGVHYFSDVVAGFLLSLSYLFLCVYFVSDVLNLL